MKLREQDPAVEAIWLLQKHLPLAFPVGPAPKVLLKEGILKDAEQHLELLGITSEKLKRGIATWCRGSRYWASMTEVAQALHARHQVMRQRGQARRNQTKPKTLLQEKAVDTPVEQIVD